MKPWTAAHFYRLILCAFSSVYHNPFLLVVAFFHFYILVCAGILCVVLYLTQTGSMILWRNLVVEEDCTSFSLLGSPELRDDDSGNAFDSRVPERKVNRVKSTKAMDGSSVESDSAKPVESTTSDDSNRFDFHNKFPLVGIQDIVTLLGEYKSKNLNISAAGKKDTCPFFPRLGMYIFNHVCFSIFLCN